MPHTIQTLVLSSPIPRCPEPLKFHAWAFPQTIYKVYASSSSFPGPLPLSWSNIASFSKIYFLSRLEIDPQLIPSCFITADHPCVLLVSDKHLCHSLLTSFRHVMLLLRNFCLETFNSNISKPHFAANIHFTCWPLHPLSG